MVSFQTNLGFEVPVLKQRLGGRKINETKLKEFWQIAENFSQLRGCYVFSIRTGRGEKPWYVGKTTQQSFAKECFSSHKVKIYNDVLGNVKGTPLLTFVVPIRKSGPWPNVAIDEVEEFLIGYAATRNTKIANKQRLPNQKWSIKGIVPGTRGAPTEQAISFKKLMGI